MLDRSIKRRKPKAKRKEDQIRVLVTEREKAQLVQAADRIGLPVASWLRSIGLQEAERLNRKRSE
jgi:mobilization protein NikA